MLESGVVFYRRPPLTMQTRCGDSVIRSPNISAHTIALGVSTFNFISDLERTIAPNAIEATLLYIDFGTNLEVIVTQLL